MTTLKYADPNGDLSIETFYKMVFEHDKVFTASLNFIKLLQWRSRKSFKLEKSNWIMSYLCYFCDMGIFGCYCLAVLPPWNK